MASLGLRYSELREKNPGLVMASITEFGQTGPYKDRNGSNLVNFVYEWRNDHERFSQGGALYAARLNGL